jgi:Tol biopolymer transport system component
MTPERYQQLADLYVAAHELAPEQRAGFLTEACRGDEALQEEVESLLRFETAGETFLDGAALDVTAEAVAAEQLASALNRRVGPYHIQSVLGSGGMGEVYRAHDPRLGRDVALKVIHLAFATDEDRLRRFEQEARTAGKLNHPNILTVYDIGLDQGSPYIVTELLEGEELRALLNQGVVPFRHALDYARQIAHGLAAAHAKGIVHRDLKPENIFITSDGRVKILDFGLVKLKLPVSGAVLTNRQPVTEPGVILGTVGYMAPEQVRGQETDGCSDIFALGVILYEMLAGRRPFLGESPVEIMNAILKEEPPDLTEASSDIPHLLEKIVRRCLEKKPEHRFQSASDLGFALDAVPTPRTPSDVSTTITAQRRSPHLRLKWLVPIAGLLFVAGLFAWRVKRLDYWWRNPLADAQFTTLTDFPGYEGHAAISRDGKFVAFLSDRDGPADVWTGQTGAGEFINLTTGRAADMRNPRVRNVGFSPDGSQVTFWVRIMGQANVWAVPTLGGQLRPHLEAAELAWSADGTKIVYHTDTAGDPIFVTESNGKAGKQIYVAERGVHCHFPVWSPQGHFIYFVRGFPPDEMDIWRITPTGGSAERLTFHNSRVAYPTLLNERTLLYTTLGDDGSGPWLYAMDVERRVAHRISFGVEQYTSIDASADGRRLVTTIANPDNSLWRVPLSDRVVDESSARRVSLPSARALSPRLGPGYMLYLSSKGGDDGIQKLVAGTSVELWNGSLGRVLEGASLSPDGSRLAFTAQKDGRNRLYFMSANGTGLRELGETLNIRGAPTWPPAGEWVTVAADRGKDPGLFNVPLDGEPPIEFVEGPSANPVWSPDGHLLVYSGAEVGTTFPIKAVTAEGKPHDLPQLILSRGANRFAFLPGRPVLIVMKGEIWHKNFWSVDLLTGEQHQLTNFSRELLISDFDVSADGREIVFGRLKENSNIVLIALPER